MKPRDTVGGYRGSGDGATMRPPAPLPSASMGKPSSRPAPYDVLSSRAALLEAAKLNLDALEALASGTVEQAAGLAQVAQSLSTYALATDRWSP